MNFLTPSFVTENIKGKFIGCRLPHVELNVFEKHVMNVRIARIKIIFYVQVNNPTIAKTIS